MNDQPDDYDRARFEESLELATTQLAFPLELDGDDEREAGA